MIIDSELQASLRARYSPPGSRLRAVQSRLLEMLRVVDSYCREHDIKYWLSSGTCLGAVRHGGYIPWDDDVDIEMDYRSYRRLRRLLRRHPMPGMALHDHDSDPEYMLTFPKLRDLYSTVTETAVENDRRRAFTGLYIDIFPMTPSCSLRLHHLSENFYHLLVCRPFKMRDSRLRSLLMRTVRPVYYKVISPVFRMLGQIGAGHRRRHLPGTAYYAPRDARDFKEVRYVDFEGIRLPVPGNAESYLTRIFGDWRSLPDLDRLTPHLSRAEIRPRPGGRAGL